MIEFVSFHKIPRLSREIIITEKLDGTNGQILIGENRAPFVLAEGRVVPFMVGSRSRWIFPEQDNHGFAAWAYAHAEDLLQLGPGSHFGEWWGQGVNRGYGLKEKRFSLFNTVRWCAAGKTPRVLNAEGRMQEVLPSCVSLVPELYRGPFTDAAIEQSMQTLRDNGSIAAPGFLRPEGIVVFHTAGNVLFKKTLEKDDEPKLQRSCVSDSV